MDLRWVYSDDGTVGIAECLPPEAFQPGDRVWTAFFGDLTTGTVQKPTMWCASVLVLWDGDMEPGWIHPGRIDVISAKP